MADLFACVEFYVYGKELPCRLRKSGLRLKNGNILMKFLGEAWKSQAETAYSQTDIPEKAGMGKIGGEEI